MIIQILDDTSLLQVPNGRLDFQGISYRFDRHQRNINVIEPHKRNDALFFQTQDKNNQFSNLSLFSSRSIICRHGIRSRYPVS